MSAIDDLRKRFAIKPEAPVTTKPPIVIPAAAERGLSEINQAVEKVLSEWPISICPPRPDAYADLRGLVPATAPSTLQLETIILLTHTGNSIKYNKDTGAKDLVNHNKYYVVGRYGHVLFTRFGPIGSPGSHEYKPLFNSREASDEMNKIVAAKLKKGYEVNRAAKALRDLD